MGLPGGGSWDRNLEISTTRIILVAALATALSLGGLAIYIHFRASSPVVAMYGAILIFAGVIALLPMPTVILRRKLRKSRRD